MESILGLMGIDPNALKDLEEKLRDFCCLVEQNNILLKALVADNCTPERNDALKRACEIIEAKYKK
jgi:hypothetical protein